MKYARFFTLFLIFCMWISTTGFAPGVDVSAISIPSGGTTMAAPADFTKDSPENGASLETTKVTLKWNPSAGAVSYEYCTFTKQKCPPGQWKSAGTSLEVTVTAKPGAVYYWNVRARGADGSLTYADNNTSWSYSVVGVALPEPFEKLAPVDGATAQPLNVTLSWTPSIGLNINYQVCISTVATDVAATCVPGWLDVGNTTSYLYQGLSYNTTYYWQVRAYNTKGTVYANGTATNRWSFTTRIAPPGAFVKNNPPDLSTELPANITLAWSTSTGATQYEYCLDKEEDNNNACDSGWVSPTPNTSTSMAVTVLLNGTYFWQVRAVNSQGAVTYYTEANDGVWWKFTTTTVPPLDVAKLSPENDATDITLTPYLYWSIKTEVGPGINVTYQYCLIPAADIACEEADWSTEQAGLSAQITSPLAAGTKYIWHVRANYGAAEPYYSDSNTPYEFTTRFAAPTWTTPTPGYYHTPEDPASPYAASLADWVDYDGTNTLSYLLYGSSPAGTLNLSSNGAFTYTPVANFNGKVTFQFTISDGANPAAGPFTAEITVDPVNDAPTLSVVEDIRVLTGTDVYFIIVASDPDLPYGDSITLTCTGACQGTLPIGAVYTPPDPAGLTKSAEFDWVAAKWTPTLAPLAFTFQVTDGESNVVDTITVTIDPYRIYTPIISR